MGRERSSGSEEHGLIKPGSENILYLRLGLSGEIVLERGGGTQGEGDGDSEGDGSSEGEGEDRDPSIGSGGDDGKEQEGESSPEEETRSKWDSSSADEGLRRQRKDLTPSIQMVKCSVEGNEMEGTSNQIEKLPSADMNGRGQEEERHPEENEETEYQIEKEGLYATPKRDSEGWISLPDRRCAKSVPIQ
ncbi:hypothetical protein AAC387_Pa12g0485 [Persea americana]